MGILSSLKVLDFSTLLPGPYATMMLADLGADVLRVESPARPDLARVAPPYDAHGRGVAHAFLNRGKRSIALDLKHPRAAEVVRRLVATHDIVVEQFRPGVMARLGLDDAALRAANPRVICCSISGYGQTGPYRERAGHDVNYAALSGLLSYSGFAESGPPPLGFQVADVCGALHAVIGILAAVVERERTGVGRHVDVSLTDAAVALNALAGAGLLAAGVEPAREAMPLNGGTAYGCFRTRDGRHLAVGGVEPAFRRRLCEGLGRPDLLPLALDESPITQRAFRDAVAARIAERTLAEWEETFAALDACVEPVLTLAEALEHPQARARGLVTDVPDPEGRSQCQLAPALVFSGDRPRPASVGAPLGAHRDEVMAALGYPESEIRALAATGLFG